MKKLVYLIIVLVALGLIVAGCLPTVPPTEQNELDNKAKPDCATIQDGTILDIANNVITLGYDQFGYNYQAHIFNGRYCDYDRVIGGDHCDVKLVMKWSDTWLSNKDCNNDNKLDRGYACNPENPISSACEGAWVTNHQSGTCINDKGKTCKWTYFVKIVMVPTDAYKDGGYWYTADGTEIGAVIWGAYAIIQQVSNDPCLGEHGILYNSPASPGLGKF